MNRFSKFKTGFTGSLKILLAGGFILGTALNAEAQNLTLTSGAAEFLLWSSSSQSSVPQVEDADSVLYTGSMDPLAQTSFQYFVRPWASPGELGVSFNLTNTSSRLDLRTRGVADYIGSYPSETTFDYSLQFDLDFRAYLTLSVLNLSTAWYPSPLSPDSFATISLDYLTSTGWVELTSYEGQPIGFEPALRFGSVAEAGSYRLTSTGLVHSGDVWLDTTIILAPVPEPSSLLLIGLAGSAFAFIRRQRHAGKV